MPEGRISEPDLVSGINVEDTKNYSISEIISFLESAFQPTDFEKVEYMLRLREEKMNTDKEALRVLTMELQNKKNEYDSLEVKFGALEFKRLVIEDELKKYKRTSDELKEEITRLEEDNKVVRERERRAKERINDLSGELQKSEKDGQERIVQLKIENRDLECGKRRAENEIEVWQKRFKELESRVLRLEEETSGLTSGESHLPEKIKVDAGVPNVVSQEEVGEKETSKTRKLQNVKNVGNNSASLAHLQPREKMLNFDETIRTSASVGSTLHPPIKESGGLQATGPPPSISINVKEGKNSIFLESEVEYGSRVRKHLAFEEGTSNRKMAPSMLGSARSASGGVIEISDSDDEPDITNMHISDIEGNGMACVSTGHSLEGALGNEKVMTSEKCLKRKCPAQRDGGNGSSCEEDFLLTSTPKRKRAPNVITSDSENDDDDDKIPIGRLKMKHLQELIHEPIASPVNRYSVAPAVSSDGDNTEESLTPSRRRLLTLRQCEEKGSAERNSPSHLNRSETKDQGNPTTQDAQEDEVQEVGSESEGESLGGFIVGGSDDSDSEDGSDSEYGDTDLALDQILSTIRRNRDNRSKWEFEADMLSAFERDPELCMKAVCALYRQQTSEEKSMKGSLYSNNRGFSKFDALRGSTLAEFLSDGDPQGELKKSAKELQKYDPKALDDCKRLAAHYSKQLFEIYQNKEDPLFLPS
ncbi:hypothetical protein HHK36_029107 [Tetracentron sinense]|uniref:Uncharacterized protein n=1 Tax=Tetracentron sinense TaxID=13715 RepID=A0A835D448_TETSI|nr:hypothetical protein HHK36_029107 [Tetracentron sinense]